MGIRHFFKTLKTQLFAPKWVKQFYKGLHLSLRTNQPFSMSIKYVPLEEFRAFYKGIRFHHKFPMGMVDLSADGDYMKIDPSLCKGNRYEKFKIVMDYTPIEKVKINLEEINSKYLNDIH